MKNVVERFKSPVVIAQIISIIAEVIIFFSPNISDAVKVVSGAIVAIINIFAGVNNPTDRENF